MPKVSEFFDDALHARLTSPTGEGSALPNIAYTSEAFHKFEQETVFRKNWVFAAFSHQFEKKGDMRPVEVAGRPVVLVKGKDGKIRAFHNVCRHRGAKLVDEPGSGKKTFVCPNHSWSYSLEGKLLARPHFFGGEKHDVNHENCHRADLLEVRCDTWHDWIFVNLDGNAPELGEYVKPIVERLTRLRF